MSALICEPHLKSTFDGSRESPPTQRLSIDVIDDTRALLESREPWNRLAGHHPFMRWEWAATWWQSFGGDRRLAVLTIRDEQGGWVGVFPLQIERRPFWGRVLSNLGNGRACSDHVRPVIEAGYEDEAVSLIAAWIGEQTDRGAVNLIEWDGVDANDPIVEKLSGRLEQRGMRRYATDIEGSWIARLPGEWGTFERQTKKCFRRKMQKAVRNRALPEVDVAILTDSSEICSRWPAFTELHEARRRALGQDGCFQDARFSEFLLESVTRSADQGSAALFMACEHQKPFAACLLFSLAGKAYLYQSGFDPSQQRLEPGHLLNTVAVQYAIERGLTHFDFLRGDEPYKSRWNTERVAMQRIRIVPRRWQARLRLQAWLAIDRLSTKFSRKQTVSNPCLAANDSPES